MCPQYSNVLIFSRPLPVVYFQRVPLYPPVGYPGITRCSTRKWYPDGYLISYPTGTRVVPVGYPGSVLPSYGRPGDDSPM